MSRAAARRRRGRGTLEAVSRPALLLAIACAAAGCNQLLDIDDPPPAPDAGPPRMIGGKVQERYKDANNVTMYRVAAGATVDLDAGGVIVDSVITGPAGEYLLELPGGASPDVVIRSRRPDDLETAVFLADPLVADATMNFTLYTPAAVQGLATSVGVVHEATDRYVLVRIIDVVGPVAGAVIGSSSGGVRYADAAGVLAPTLTQTSASGLAAIFAVKAPSITLSVSTPASGTRQRELEIQPALTAFVQMRPN